MYIYCQICYFFHWTTSFVVYVVGAVITLYTMVVRFSFNQRAAAFAKASARQGGQKAGEVY
jgi:ABC-type protease/lipase transport system fused ATPase/permease subunit